MGVIQCAKTIKPKFANFMFTLPNLVKFLKILAKRAKICNLYVKVKQNSVKRVIVD